MLEEHFQLAACILWERSGLRAHGDLMVMVVKYNNSSQ